MDPSYSFINDSRTALEVKNYKNSYMNLEAAFNVSKKDTLYLYNAALVATEAKDYNIPTTRADKLNRILNDIVFDLKGE